MKRKNKYSFSELIKTAYSVIVTRLFYPGFRIVRRPVYIRGKKSISGGYNGTFGRGCRMDLHGKKKTLKIGDDCEFGDYTHIVALNKVEIGNNVLVASKVFISDCSHGCYGTIDGYLPSSPDVPPNERGLVYGKVVIGDNVWIGENAVILMGANIGSGCIIGANSVISKTIPNNSIVVSNNKLIKKYDFEKKQWVHVNEGADN